MTSAIPGASRKRITRSTLWLVALLLLCQLGFFVASNGLQRDYEKRRQERFVLLVDDLVDNIDKRLRQHEQILLGAAGLLDASTQVNRSEWRSYVARLKLEQNYPGILGLGFAQILQPEEVASHEAAVRAEGFPDFSVHPMGERPLYSSIVFLEPFSGRNLAAFGFDMLSEQTRAEAAYRAAEGGVTSITGKVKLVQENQGKVQAGFLMYVPVYRQNIPLNSPAQRLQALLGFTYSPYRMDDLLAGILDESEISTDVVLKIFDGVQMQAEQQMFDSANLLPGSPEQSLEQGAEWPLSSPDLLTKAVPIHRYGRTWALQVTSTPAFDQRFASHLPETVLVMGSGITLLLGLLLASTLRQRNQAQRLADKMTAEFHEASAQTRKLSMVATHTDNAVVITDANARIEWVNAGFTRITGYQLDECLGKTPGSFLQGPLTDPATVAQIRQSLSQHQRVTAEVLNYAKDGHSYWLALTIEPIYDERGELCNFIAIESDISERKRGDQMKNDFVSTVSHELRTPLTSIGGSLGLILGGVVGEVPPLMRPMLEIANSNCERLSHLINDLLDMEKLSAGKMTFDIQRHALQPLVQQVIESMRPFALLHEVQLELVEVPHAVMVMVDDMRLQQVLTNLLSNAAKFSPPGETVLIEVSQQEQTVQVRVSDRGPGISEEFQSRIFKKFSQADSSATRTKGGTGLGLAISKEMIEQMQGTIGFSSAAGQGSSFYFELPVVETQELS